MELLAPAGGPEQFRAALAAGADAIYCGVGTSFNARRGAHNFNYDEFEAACREAHLAGSRVYVTINVVVTDDELPRALALVRSCAIRGADAFIVQDWGLFAEIRHVWPELELHVSTQANVHDARGVAWAAARGAERVTLSRELSLAEMAHIAETGVELEVFGHGAICFCYSGLCLMSSMAGGRSANRGLCAQPCRLPYELVDEAGRVIAAPERTRPLCPKDMCTAGDVVALAAAGVGALKVEGRMKAADYVWSVIGAYREVLDGVAGAVETRCRRGDELEIGEKANDSGIRHSERSSALCCEVEESGRKARDHASASQRASQPDVSTPLRSAQHDVYPAEIPEAVGRRLKRAFNRDFTDAYLWGRSGDELMSYERSNNRGQLVGEVVACEGGQVQRRDGRGNLHADPRQDKKRARCEVRIRLAEPVGAGDLLELRPVDDPDAFLTATVAADAAAGATIACKVSRRMPVGCPVRVIRSKAAHVGCDAALSREVARRRQVDVRIVARLGRPLRIELACVGGHPAFGEPARAAVEGFVVEPARTKAVTRDELVEHVGRMGGSPFVARHFEVDLDEGCGMGFSAVHKLRTAACEALEQEILAPYSACAKALGPAPNRLDAPDPAFRPQRIGRLAAAGARQSGASSQSAPAASANMCAAVTGSFATDAAPAPEVCVLAPTPEVARAALGADATRVYATADALSAGEWPAGTVPVLDEVCREADHSRLDAFVCPDEPVAVGNVSELALAAERGAVAELRGCVPVHNASALKTLEEAGAKAIWLSPELSLAEIERLAPLAHGPVGIVVSGRVRVMTSEHCVLQAADACIHDCARCGLRARRLALRAKDGRLMPVRTDVHGRSRIYDAAPLDLVPELGRLVAAGVTRLCVDATLLGEHEAAREVSRIARAVAGARAGHGTVSREPGATSGHLFASIG